MHMAYDTTAYKFLYVLLNWECFTNNMTNDSTMVYSSSCSFKVICLFDYAIF